MTPDRSHDHDLEHGVWTEIEWTVLEASERATNVPADTRGFPYRARVRGIGVSPVVGEDAEVVSPSGRTMRGRVVDVNPGYQHSFGRPLPEWVRMKQAVQALVLTQSADEPAVHLDDGSGR